MTNLALTTERLHTCSTNQAFKSNSLKSIWNITRKASLKLKIFKFPNDNNYCYLCALDFQGHTCRLYITAQININPNFCCLLFKMSDKPQLARDSTMAATAKVSLIFTFLFLLRTLFFLTWYKQRCPPFWFCSRNILHQAGVHQFHISIWC